MANFLRDDFNRIMRSKGNSVPKVILVNVLMFLLVYMVGSIVGYFTNLPVIGFMKTWLSLPGDFVDTLYQPWSYVTNIFMHADIFHILFNMLILFWFGRIMTEYLNDRKFFGVFLIGGLVGSIAFVLLSTVLNIFGDFSNLSGYLLGASGGVLAVVVATATLLPNFTMNLLLIGPVRLKYIALAMLVFSTLLNFETNTGGKIAHLGGAAFGYWYILELNQGRDRVQWLFNLLDRISGLFGGKPKMRVAYRKTGGGKKANKPSYSKMDTSDKQKLTDHILDKISKSGYESLTKEEKEFLFRISNDK